MKYAEWLETVPSEIINDPIWKLEVYRLALFIDDIGWPDVLALSKNNLMWGVADQLHRSLGSISANLTEGILEVKDLTALVFSKSLLDQPARAETGITNLDMFYRLKSSNIV